MDSPHENTIVMESPDRETAIIDYLKDALFEGYESQMTRFGGLDDELGLIDRGIYETTSTRDKTDGSFSLSNYQGSFSLSKADCAPANSAPITGNWGAGIAGQWFTWNIDGGGNIDGSGSKGCHMTGTISPYPNSPVFSMSATLTGCGQWDGTYKGLAAYCYSEYPIGKNPHPSGLSIALHGDTRALVWPRTERVDTLNK